ncbi:dihydroorotate dehydrogenase [Vulcanisaeta distributa]|uniref:Dihydroorotate oxidase n=1 Tax=Vulcanisaeta distributa (strain DSM 14429 / JCM 11212 / NBRC 100878 / IC-017) TaxID=572478 RepID=E1QQK0_VULDI|nr:dihydroorotate oxidase [Vulcanisaeta distributa]ADN50495.1 Dihydroorotate oxidase [Vulcanisaeta distributa DSM 14429]
MLTQVIKLINYLPPEFTYETSHALIRSGIVNYRGYEFEMPVEVNGKSIKNPIGLGAGIDKDGFLAPWIARAGIGFITIGSITLKPRPGNPKPRIVKYPGLKAMVNAMGLPSRGFTDFVSRLPGILSKLRRLGAYVIISLAGFSIGEFMYMLNGLRGYDVDAVELNISSPTYRGSWVTDREYLGELLRSVEAFPGVLFVKLPLGVDIEFYRWVVNVAEKRGFGLTIANTLPIKEPGISVGYGGLSGYPIYPIVKSLIVKVRRWGFRNPIIGLGGVFHGRQVVDLLRNGADMVGVVTAFAYEGPFVFNRLFKEVLMGLSERL